MEFESVYDALEYLYEVSQAEEMLIKHSDKDGLIEEHQATAKDLQYIMYEVVVSIADFLEVSEIYLP